MRSRTLVAAVVAAALAVVVAGCGGKEGGGPGSAPKKATTPMQALQNVVEAIKSGDKAAFVACFDVTLPKHKQMLECTCDMAYTTKQFEDAMKKAYGPDAVKKESGSDEFDTFCEGVTIKEDGDKAVATKQGKDKPLNLVRKDGAWKIDAADMVPPGKENEIDQGIKMMSKMTQVMKDARSKVGKPGYTAEKINKEVGEAMMGAMMENMPQPPSSTGD